MRYQVVRIAVMLLGLLGGAVCAVLGTYWMIANQNKHELRSAVLLLRGKMHAARTAEDKAALESDYRGLVGQYRSYPFLLAALGLGVAGGILTFKGRRFCGAALLLATVAGLALLHPPTLLFTSLLALAGILAFFAPPPHPAPVPYDE